MAPTATKERIRIESRRATHDAFRDFARGVSCLTDDGKNGDTAAIVERLLQKLDEVAQKNAMARPHRMPGWLLTIIGGIFLMMLGGLFTGVMTFSAMQQRQSNDEARIQDMSIQLQRSTQDEAAISAIVSKVDLLVAEFTSIRERLDREFDKR